MSKIPSVGGKTVSNDYHLLVIEERSKYYNKCQNLKNRLNEKQKEFDDKFSELNKKIEEVLKINEKLTTFMNDQHKRHMNALHDYNEALDKWMVDKYELDALKIENESRKRFMRETGLEEEYDTKRKSASEETNYPSIDLSEESEESSIEEILPIDLNMGSEEELLF